MKSTTYRLAHVGTMIACVLIAIATSGGRKEKNMSPWTAMMLIGAILLIFFNPGRKK
jgi:hypothetical protein